jgi:hypothetical protein
MLRPNNTGTEPSAVADPATKRAETPSQIGSDIGAYSQVMADIGRL